MELSLPDIAVFSGLVEAIVEDGQWRPGIGDPSVMGWVTVGAYVLGTALCAWSAARAATRRPHDPAAFGYVYFWAGLAVLLLLLGVNKQLDLQTWLWLAGRRLAHEQGWYESRRTVQIVFVVAVAFAGLLLAGLFCWLSRKALRHHFLALAGALVVTSFVVIRAASFHHVDAMLGWRVADVKMNCLLELPGILCVCVSALHTLFRPPR